MTDTDAVIKLINNRFDGLYHTDKEGNRHPFVCIVCDEFLRPKEMTTINVNLLRMNENNLRVCLDHDAQGSGLNDDYNETQSDTQSETQTEIQDEIHSETQSDTQNENQTNNQTNTKFNNQSNNQPDEQTENQTDFQSDTQNGGQTHIDNNNQIDNRNENFSTRISRELRGDYIFVDDRATTDDTALLSRLLLSPRAAYVERKHHLSFPDGYTCCRPCKQDLTNLQRPVFSVANNYMFGNPPACIEELSDVELAMISPIRSYGYCFTYTGGKNKNLRGTLSFQKVKIDRLTRAVAHFERLGINDCVVVLFYGNLTPEQKEKARKYSTIDTGKVSRAVAWLLENNSEWNKTGRNLSYYQERLLQPTCVDSSIQVDGVDNNVETTEQWTVCFPDDTITNVAGGQEDMEQFRVLVQKYKSKNYDLDFQCGLQSEYVQDFKDSNLVNACIKQFPYGRGGLNERRLNKDGSCGAHVDLEAYVRHLSLISKPEFQEESFSLILYNMYQKQKMVRSAGMNVRSGVTAATLGVELTQEDIDKATNDKIAGVLGNGKGARLLDAIDSVARSIPHSNDAVKRARQDGYAHQHTFGMSSWFLTIAPDDDCSIIIQIYSGADVDLTRDCASTLSDEELRMLGRQRSSLRIKYPGLCALYFDLAMEIIFDEVIGWDLKKQESIRGKGLFGPCQAFTGAIEEQGRKTLHIHLQIWVRKFNEMRDEVFQLDPRVTKEVTDKLVAEIEKVSSCSLFQTSLCPTSRGGYSAFPHKCKKSDSQRKPPMLVDDQCLRDLRHEVGHMDRKGLVAFCLSCDPQTRQEWTSERFVESYLVHGVGVTGLTKFPDGKNGDIKRLKAMGLDYQRSLFLRDEKVHTWLDAAHSFHVHTSSCFSYGTKKKKKRKRQDEDNTADENKKRKQYDSECRYRHPKKPRRYTVFENVTELPINWYDWRGRPEKRQIREVCLKRHKYDIFQNTSCPAIGHSKFACNTNISAVMPGPTSQYQFKYCLKNTQEDDTEEYKKVANAIKRTLARVAEEDNENVLEVRRRAIRLVLSGTFAHQANNVIGSPLAAYLTRKGSRFLFSHKTAWCPIRDIYKLLSGTEAHTSISYTRVGLPYFQCHAMHYLCRPLETNIETLCPYDFYSLFETVGQNSRRKTGMKDFVNDRFKHPSFNMKSGRFEQGLRPRIGRALVKVFAWDFQDTAKFGCDLTDVASTITDDMEDYCRNVLLLFATYRCLEDIVLNGSFVLKFRNLYEAGYFRDDMFQFLSNIQDCNYNSFRFIQSKDDLQRGTQLYQSRDGFDDVLQEEEQASNELEGTTLDLFIDMVEGNDDEKDDVDEILPGKLTLTALRNKGRLKCGYELLADMTIPSMGSPVPNITTNPNDHPIGASEAQQNTDDGRQDPPKQKELVQLLMSKRTGRSRLPRHNEAGPERSFPAADGSAASIIGWANANFGTDVDQRRAFEMISASFVLTFHLEAAARFPFQVGTGEQDDKRTHVNRLKLERKRLERLIEFRKRRTHQLICLLHGPGGCGKTTVIDTVVEYAREFCDNMPNYQFTARTIVITAMTGVAATILMGETTHKALYLNKKGDNITHENIQAWAETRLVVVDEISFAGRRDIEKIQTILCRLKQVTYNLYGGLDIVFSGDLRQLEPIAPLVSLYKDQCTEFTRGLNCFVELKGLHRFKDNLSWGHLLYRFRDGVATQEDIATINARVIRSNHELPPDIKYATFFNRDRDAINAALFYKRCLAMYRRFHHVNDSIIILSDNIKIKRSDRVFVPFRNRSLFWSECGEDDLKLPKTRGRIDPVLKLYVGCKVMIPKNSDVKSGIANGTQAVVVKVVLAKGAIIKTVVVDGVPIKAVFASDVERLELKHQNKRIQPQHFSIKPEKFTFQARLPAPATIRLRPNQRDSVPMSAVQFGLISNSATTGHKLQGSSVDNIFVHSWSYHTNWPYVLLSRVRTIAGLFLRVKLSNKLDKYSVPEELTELLQFFRREYLISYLTEEQYDMLM